jgi:predicted alpha/beta-hydrolase family hydrolase
VEEHVLPADPELLLDGPSDAPRTVALAHGAGAGMESPFLEFFAKGLGGLGYRVVRFEYPYMASQRRTGRKKPPDREPVLRETWLKVVELLKRESPACENSRLVIGGKSLGGRIASLVADEAGVAGLVCLGYPFHPVGKPDRVRAEDLRTLRSTVPGRIRIVGGAGLPLRRCLASASTRGVTRRPLRRSGRAGARSPRVSDGQSGVDRAALDVALELGIACGGWCPRGRKAEDGVIPQTALPNEIPLTGIDTLPYFTFDLSTTGSSTHL